MIEYAQDADNRRKLMNLPTTISGESCMCYRIDKVRAVRKLLPVGLLHGKHKRNVT